MALKFNQSLHSGSLPEGTLSGLRGLRITRQGQVCQGDLRVRMHRRGICKKNCPEGAIKLVQKVAVIDQEKCTQCGTCIDVCPKVHPVRDMHRCVPEECYCEVVSNPWMWSHERTKMIHSWLQCYKFHDAIFISVDRSPKSYRIFNPLASFGTSNSTLPLILWFRCVSSSSASLSSLW